ncbi:MAG: hypothetical protein J1F22_05125 [Lachnospiraceae bacterium]|nr:hypothetical protein [Lachnospiraceae bacterium]
MKKRSWRKVISMTMLAAFFVTGCGTVTSGDHTEASGASTTGNDAKTVGNLIEKNPSRYGNSTNYYLSLSELHEGNACDGGDDGIVQFRNDGTRVGTAITKEDTEILYVDDAGICYEKTFSDDKQAIYYLPIRKGEEGDEPLEPEKEEIKLESDLIPTDAVTGNSKYILYYNFDGEFIRYDRQKKTKAVERPFGNLEEELDIVSNDIGVLGIFENEYLIYHRTSDLKNTITTVLRKQNLDTLKWETVSKRKSHAAPIVDSVQSGNFLFYWKQPISSAYADFFSEIDAYDFRTGEDQVLCTEEDLSEKLYEEGLAGGRYDFSLYNVFCEGDRAYIQLRLTLKNDEICESKVVIFSISMEDKTLVYEKELCEAIWENSAYKRGVWKSYINSNEKETGVTYRQNAGQCEMVADGKAFLFLNKPMDKIQFACFDLNTGKLRKFDKKSVEYVEMQRKIYDTLYMYEDDNLDFYIEQNMELKDWEYEK